MWNQGHDQRHNSLTRCTNNKVRGPVCSSGQRGSDATDIKGEKLTLLSDEQDRR
jgi:hypothetical protein